MEEWWSESVIDQCTDITLSELILKKDSITKTGAKLIESILIGRMMLCDNNEKTFFIEKVNPNSFESRKARDIFVLSMMVEEPSSPKIFNLVIEYELDIKASDIAYFSGFLALSRTKEEILEVLQ